MLDIPIGKALIAVETDLFAKSVGKCDGCFLACVCPGIACTGRKRADGKNVIFKLVDMPKEAARE